MADYAKKKNDELAALCKERGLAHTGKKADLVKRLEDADAKPTDQTSGQATAKPATEDEIDWDDEPATEAAAATTEPAAAAIAAGGTGQPKNPQAVPNQQAAQDPSKADDLKVEAVPGVDGAASKETATNAAIEEHEPAEDFSLGLAARTLDEEIEKRKKRAAKFGTDPKDDERLKLLERAKRFGNVDLPGLLNKALPERAEREKKRGREGRDDTGAGARKRSRQRPAPGRREPSGKIETAGSHPTWMTADDRERAERRKAKFDTTGK